ncbi:bifunctional 2',3'-cyclic-nucleotide 2'-phosphodiesterase/3'-nucleotidase [Loktanella agnita]|uniref:bifunctional 2',3'-cyclic-nucleotide 2'-phosphodiesterase/3'-nucleotidase n=1 Tax=Loktanella agnita TaxID=287097 RepID=UPI003987633C
MTIRRPDPRSINTCRDLPTARLRVLETTDLHMQLLDYNYFTDQHDRHSGLIQLADIIDARRNEAGVTTLLFDNGDFLQGNPLADFVANGAFCENTHPMIAAFNTLNYDAVTLGNHEFNYGLDFLRATLAGAAFPVICSNLQHKSQPPLAEPFIILYRTIACDDGTTRDLRVGVCGFVPPQITDWDHQLLQDDIATDDIVAAATQVVPRIKAAGADIIVALCHAGISPTEHHSRMENAAVPLAAVPGIDVILTGHTHEKFPDETQQHTAAIDPAKGTLHGKPAIMAGCYGKHLGVIDLQLGWNTDHWTILDHACHLTPAADTGENPSALRQQLTEQVMGAHQATLRHIRQPIARTAVPIHSYFAAVMPDMAQQMLAEAQQNFIASALSDTAWRDLPVLSATAPFRAGGPTGADQYINIAPGLLTLRDAAAIYPFPNTLCAARRTGAQIRRWLERAASHFMQITPGLSKQPLIDPHHAPYNLDTLHGLSYDFDLTVPAMYDAGGALRCPTHKRLRNLRFQGQPVQDEDIFVIATNSYRVNGGGSFQSVGQGDLLFTSREMTRDILIRHLQSRAEISGSPTKNWDFTPIPDTSAQLLSAPNARHHMSDRMDHMGPGPDGFDCFSYHF